MSMPICLMLCAMLFSCIRTSDQNTVRLDLQSETKEISKEAVGQLSVYKFVYREDKWPLSDFFHRMASGEFVQAFRKIDLKYYPSNVDNEALQELLDKGLIPAYVRVVNEGTSPATVRLNDIVLRSDKKTYMPLTPDNLPSVIKKINPAAIAANIGNTVMTVVLVVSVCVLAMWLGSVPGNAPMTPMNTAGGPSDGPWGNKIVKTTHVVYGDYLFKDVVVKPGEATEGIVFFSLPAKTHPDELQMHFNQAD